MSKKSSFHAIKDILGKIVSQSKWNSQIKKYALWEQWDSLVGAKIAQHAKPKKWMSNILVVAVDNSVWLNELRMMEREILGKIREGAETKIEGIRWVLR